MEQIYMWNKPKCFKDTHSLYMDKYSCTRYDMTLNMYLNRISDNKLFKSFRLEKN